MLEKENIEIDEITAADSLVNHDTAAISSVLPLIMIETKGQQIYKERTIWGEISVVARQDGNNLSDQDPDFITTATIKYRGASSYAYFDKRQFRIKFYKNKNSAKEIDYGLAGMGKDCEWVLNGPFLDRTLIRNQLLYSISKEIMPWAPDSRFCEVLIDGKYQGVYLVVEPVTNGENRLRLSKIGLLSGKTAYIIKRDRPGTETNIIHPSGEEKGTTAQELSIQYPADKNLTEVQSQWIENDVSKFEEVLYSDYFADPEIGYQKYIDVDSFVDYLIINEVAMIDDAGQLSTYTYKELDGKLTMTVWDFNNAFDNYIIDNEEYDDFFVNKNWFERLLEDRAFVDKVVERYRQLRGGILSNQSMNKYIDSDVAYLGTAVDRNFSVWGYTFHQKLLSSNDNGNSRDPKNYPEAVDMLKKSIEKRMEFLDNHLTDLYQEVSN